MTAQTGAVVVEEDFNLMSHLFSCQVSGGILMQLNEEVLHYDYHASFFDIFVRSLTFFTFHKQNGQISLLNFVNVIFFFITFPSFLSFFLPSFSSWLSSGSQLSSWPTLSVSFDTGGP